eukprot:COSAG02_NODE_1441_length_12586_cov_484.135581_8_plen_376_part_00
MLAGLLTCPLSVLSLSATPLPQRWSARNTGLCGGGIAPSATTCSGHAVPGFSTSEAAWPFQKTGYEDAAFAAAACKKSCAGCIAVTCGPGEAPAPQNITAWCWARSQNNAFCTVPGYSSFSDFPKPPPPPPAFRLPSIFADHMVLQRATAPPGPSGAALWGHASPRSTVSVTLKRAGVGGVVASANSTAGRNGTWRVKLLYAPPAAAALAQHTIAITSSADQHPIVLSDVLFGEVWLITGQSNAAFTVAMQASGFGALAANATAEISGAAAYADRIRLFNTGNDVSAAGAIQTELQHPPQLPWSRPSTAALSGKSVMGDGAFSAVGWYFARGLQPQVGVPIGMVMATCEHAADLTDPSSLNLRVLDSTRPRYSSI